MKFIIFVFFTLVASYFLGLTDELLGDDLFRIKGNTELDSLRSALTGGLGDRPLLMFFMWLEKSVFGIKYSLWKVTNLMFQTFAAHQLYLFLQDLSAKHDKKILSLSFICAFIFAIHPLHGQSITNIIQGGVLIAGFFGLLSMRVYFRFLKEKKSQDLILSVLALVLAFLAKPIVSFLPLFYLIASYSLDGKNLKEKWYLLPYFSTIFIPAFFYLFRATNLQVQPISSMNYFLTQSEVIFTYIRLMIFPYGLSFLHDVTFNSEVWLNHRWIFVLIHLVIVFLAWKTLKSKLHFLFFIGFYVALIPESSFFPIDYFIFEHRTYFALAFLITFIYVVAEKSEEAFQRIILIVSAIVSCTLIFLNQLRNLQINTTANWMLNTLNSSYFYHHYNFSFTYQLLEQGKWQELTPVIERYKKVYPNATRYNILADMHEYHARPEKRDELLVKISEYLSTPFEGVEFRRRREVNKFILVEVEKSGVDFDEIVFIEKMLSKQIKTFKSNVAEYGIFLQIYKNYAHLLLSEKYQTIYRNKDYVNYLKTQTILTFYFGEKFEDLPNKIKAALKDDPNSAVLNRLNEMLAQ